MTKTMISTISKNYAKALMETIEQKSFEKIEKQLTQIAQVIESSEDLRIVMSNSSISTATKIEIIDSIFNKKIDSKLLNLLKILIEKNRFNEFESIRAEYSNMLEKRSNKKTVEVFSSIELNFENKSNVLFKLEHKLGCEITPIWKVDKTLIAGLAFKIDDCVIDTSVRAKLADLSKNINR
ncbi:ATP synthase F1 subunit delta [bacterium]|nr:ATP synthase F1 subunit delta [bacterium]